MGTRCSEGMTCPIWRENRNWSISSENTSKLLVKPTTIISSPTSDTPTQLCRTVAVNQRVDALTANVNTLAQQAAQDRQQAAIDRQEFREVVNQILNYLRSAEWW